MATQQWQIKCLWTELQSRLLEVLQIKEHCDSKEIKTCMFECATFLEIGLFPFGRPLNMHNPHTCTHTHTLRYTHTNKQSNKAADRIQITTAFNVFVCAHSYVSVWWMGACREDPGPAISLNSVNECVSALIFVYVRGWEVDRLTWGPAIKPPLVARMREKKVKEIFY